MDATAVWTAIGVLCALLVAVAGTLVGLLTAENVRCRREVKSLEGRVAALERRETDYLLKLTEMHDALRRAEHDKNDALQAVLNMRALFHELSGGKSLPGGP